MAKTKSKIKLWIVTAGVIVTMLFSCIFVGCSPTNGAPTDEYTITFNYNDGVSRNREVYKDKESGDSIQEPAAPVRAGYSFIGWNTLENGSGTTISFPYLPTGDITFFAQWDASRYTVTFNAGDGTFGSSSTATIEAAYGNIIPENDRPSIPTRDEYTFRNWLTPAGEAADLATWIVPGDVTLTALWVSIYVVDITFNYNYIEEGKELPETSIIELDRNGRITQRQAPSPQRLGYKLLGWSTDSGATEANDGLFPFNYPGVGNNTTLYAVWEEQIYTVNYLYNYTGAPSISQVISGLFFQTTTTYAQGITNTGEIPLRSGYTFDGWYTASLGGTKLTFPYTISRHATLYAHWKSVPVTTNTFHAEYVYFDPSMSYPGYSGSVAGTACIISEEIPGAVIDTNYMLNGTAAVLDKAYCVSYQYIRGAKLTFVINSSAEVKNASLVISATQEFQAGLAIGPDNVNANKIRVNGNEIKYSDITLPVRQLAEYTIGNIELIEGENIIEIEVANDNRPLGGTYKAVGFIIDYIKINNIGSAQLSWSPIFDNLEGASK